MRAAGLMVDFLAGDPVLAWETPPGWFPFFAAHRAFASAESLALVAADIPDGLEPAVEELEFAAGLRPEFFKAQRAFIAAEILARAAALIPEPEEDLEAVVVTLELDKEESCLSRVAICSLICIARFNCSTDKSLILFAIRTAT